MLPSAGQSNSVLCLKVFSSLSPCMVSSPAISPCLWRRRGKTSTLKCSCQTGCTVSASGGSTPWMNWWSITRRPLSSPVIMEISCTWWRPCCDLYVYTGFPPTHSLTHSHIRSILVLTQALAVGPSRCGVRTTSGSSDLLDFPSKNKTSFFAL